MVKFKIFPIYYIVWTLLTCVFMISCSNNEDYFSLEGADIGKYIVAHRGNWKQHNLPQNSIASLKDAIRMDIYGVELDVRQTKDSILVINHDPFFHDLNISNSTYIELSKYKLDNGEMLPTLDDFMSVLINTDTKARLVIEIKECDLNLLLSKIVNCGLLDRVEFVTFQRDYCDNLVEMGYGDMVSYTIGDLSSAISPKEIKDSGYGGVCYDYRVLDQNKNWISEAAELGVKINVWTVDELYTIKQYADMGLLVTTNVSWACVPQNKK